MLSEPWRTILACGMILVLLQGLFALAWGLRKWAGVHAELTRKLMHVGMGLIVLSFPWLFHTVWPVALMGGGAAAMLVCLRILSDNTGLKGVIGGVNRVSWGEVYFPLIVVILFWLTVERENGWVLYVIPLLILALADALAALIGLRYGRTKYLTQDGVKSVEGSIAFFGTTFLATHVPLLLWTDTGRTESLLIGLMLGLLGTMLEAIAWRGLDNLFVPLGAYVLLQLFLEMSTQQLGLRCLVTTLMMFGVFAWRWRTRLDDSALVAVAFFGYTVLMVGGWMWTVAPVAVFLAHLILYPRHLEGSNHTDGEFSVRAVTATIGPGAVCLTCFGLTGWSPWLVPFATSFAVQLARIAISSDQSANARSWAAKFCLGVGAVTCSASVFCLTMTRQRNTPSWEALLMIAGIQLLLTLVCAASIRRALSTTSSVYRSSDSGRIFGTVLSGCAAGIMGAVSWLTLG